MVNNLFLTETRREVLDGTTELEGNALSVQKSRIRTRARMALEELQKVANSSEIENRSVFDPWEVRLFLSYLLWDPASTSGGGLVGGADPDDDVHVDVTDAHQEYQRELYTEIDAVLRKYHQPGTGFTDE